MSEHCWSRAEDRKVLPQLTSLRSSCLISACLLLLSKPGGNALAFGTGVFVCQMCHVPVGLSWVAWLECLCLVVAAWVQKGQLS